MGLIDNLKNIWDPPTRTGNPPWFDRLQEAAYTPQSGQRITFDYEDVSVDFEARGTAFDFSSADGTYVQKRGRSGNRYPLRIFFWGDDYDREASVFDAALREPGFGTLEHPAYGTVNVAVFGRVVRRDDLKTAANQAVYEVTFWESIQELYPAAQADTKSKILSAVDAFNEAFGDQFDRQLDLSTQIERQSFLDKYNEFLDKTQASLEVIAEAQQDTADKFNAVVDSIKRGIDVLIGSPLALARQTQIMIQTPARAVTSIRSQLDAYGNLASDIFGLNTSAPNGNDSRNTNEFHNNEMYASGYVISSAVASLSTQFVNSAEAIEASVAIDTLFESFLEWYDDNYQSIAQTLSGTTTEGSLDPGDAYQQMSTVIGLVTGYLVNLSFTLKQERSVVLDRDRTIIDLASELYKDEPDDYLDAMIDDNNLSADEILELRRGTEIVYYV